MATFDEYIDALETGIKGLAKESLGGFGTEALRDSRDFIEKTKDDLERWIQQVQAGELSKQDFEWLLQGKKDLLEMHSLEQKGIAIVEINRFKGKLYALLVSTAFDMLV
jgi:ATP-dependent Clp protease ATP-binding subunit ClpA